jgi:hypothetical protein
MSVKELVSEEEFMKIEELRFKRTLAEMPNIFHCKTVNCNVLPLDFSFH